MAKARSGIAGCAIGTNPRLQEALQRAHDRTTGCSSPALQVVTPGIPLIESALHIHAIVTPDLYRGAMVSDSDPTL
jgi:hypothetical protein